MKIYFDWKQQFYKKALKIIYLLSLGSWTTASTSSPAPLAGSSTWSGGGRTLFLEYTIHKYKCIVLILPHTREKYCLFMELGRYLMYGKLIALINDNVDSNWKLHIKIIFRIYIYLLKKDIQTGYHYTKPKRKFDSGGMPYRNWLL